jgi:hypothetical protein
VMLANPHLLTHSVARREYRLTSAFSRCGSRVPSGSGSIHLNSNSGVRNWGYTPPVKLPNSLSRVGVSSHSASTHTGHHLSGVVSRSRPRKS